MIYTCFVGTKDLRPLQSDNHLLSFACPDLFEDTNEVLTEDLLDHIIRIALLYQGFNKQREGGPGCQLFHVTMRGRSPGLSESAVKQMGLGRAPHLSHIKSDAHMVRTDQLEEIIDMGHPVFQGRAELSTVRFKKCGKS